MPEGDEHSGLMSSLIAKLNVNLAELSQNLIIASDHPPTPSKVVILVECNHIEDWWFLFYNSGVIVLTACK